MELLIVWLDQEQDQDLFHFPHIAFPTHLQHFSLELLPCNGPTTCHLPLPTHHLPPTALLITLRRVTLIWFLNDSFSSFAATFTFCVLFYRLHGFFPGHRPGISGWHPTRWQIFVKGQQKDGYFELALLSSSHDASKVAFWPRVLVQLCFINLSSNEGWED